MRTRVKINFFISVILLSTFFLFILPREYNLFMNLNVKSIVKLAWFVSWIICALILTFLIYSVKFQGLGDLFGVVIMLTISPLVLLTIGLSYISIKIWPIQNTEVKHDNT